MGNIEDRDTAYIWLRQTAELTLGDQRRTLEIAVPVRPGATPEEVNRLLDEAEAGMERLAERMDRRVVALRAAAAVPAQAGSSTRPAAPSVHPAPSAPSPTNGVAERPPAPTRPAPSPGAARPAAAPGAAATSVPAAGAMSRAEFLEQARVLGQSPRQVMERLAVRTLEGLNYAEALEQIKRQLLRESTEAPQDATPASLTPPAASALAAEPAQPAKTTPEPPIARNPIGRFDEEDDYDVSFELPEDGDMAELDPDTLDSEPDDSTADEVPPAPESASRGRRGARPEPGEPDELDLEDVPDFAKPRPATRGEPAAKPRGAAAASSASAPAAGADSAASSRPAPLTSHQALAQRARAHDLLARLREYRGGSPAGSDQIGPFTNVVVHQLGEPMVESLTDQVWGLTPDQLSAPQMRALIQWGKTDNFATEVAAVLDLLASEHAPDAAGETQGPAAKSGRPAARAASRGAGSAR